MLIIGLGLPLAAQASLTLTPLTWNIVGLDSNTPATGPNHFPIGARICSNVLTNNAVANFVWDSPNVNVNLRAGTLATLNFPTIAANSCVDAYFEVEVTKVPAAFDTTRRYHIEAIDGSGTFSTTVPREVYVEHLVSQSRNSITNLRYGLTGGALTSVPAGGGLNLVVGNTYDIELSGGTATQGYEQFEAFINFTNTIFQIISVNTTYSADTTPHVTSPNDKLYGDACLWQNDPNSPNYRSCQDVGKIGGSNVVSLYTIRVIGGGGTQQTLNTLLYDFSGSSYHYNADFGTGARIGNIIDPATATIDKAFVPNTTTVGGISTLKITLNNPNAGALPDYNFVDNLPAGMSVANPPNATTSNCGTPIFAPTAGATTLNFSNGTVAANSSCTISVSVTTNAVGNQAFTNTTNNLFVGTTNTGDNASAILTVTTAPPPPACTAGLTMASWAFGTTTLPPPTTFKAGNVTTATASFTERGGTTPNSIDTLNGQPANAWAGTGWNRSADPVPTAATTSFFEFTVSTGNHSTQPVSIGFQANPITGWANPSDNEIYVFASVDGGAFSTIFSSTTIQRNLWNTIPASAAATAGASSTVFRVIGRGRSNGSPNAPILLDNVVITGCGVPVHPTIAKGFAPNPIAVGATSTLSFTLTNPNTIALTGAAFTDTLPTGMTVAAPLTTTNTCGGTWAPSVGASALTFSGGVIPLSGSCILSVNVTTNVAGPSTNISNFISTTQTGTNNGPGGSATATLTALAPPQIVKEFAPSPILANGVSTVTLTIINPNQNNAMAGVAFTDNLPNAPGIMRVANPPSASTLGCGAPVFAPVAAATTVTFSGGSIVAGGTCTVKFNVTAPSVGSYTNNSGTVSHIVNGTPANGNNDGDVLVVNPPNPGIALLKEVGPTAAGPWSSFLAVNLPGNVFYRFTIENVGDVALSPISLTDPPGGPAVACAPALPASLPVADAFDDGHIATCVIGPVAAVSGTNVNTARATGTGGTPVSDEDSATYGSTGLTIDKTANPTTYTVAGNVITYTFVVTNSGFATLNGPISVLDNRSTDESCPALTTIGDFDNFFDPGEQITCTSTYTIVAGDVSSGSVTNIATATNGTTTSPPDTATVNLIGPRLTLDKSASAGSFTVGLPASYTFTVTNSGTANTSGNIVVSDTLPAGITLASFAGAGWNCVTVGTPNVTCTYTGAALVPAASTAVTINVNIGPAATSGDNSATASGGGDPTCPAAARCTDTVPVTILAPVLSTVKSGVLNNAVVAPNTSTEIGDQINYTIMVTNSGTGVATNVTVADARLPGLVCVPANGSSIAAGASMTCTGTYTLVNADIIAASVSNTATTTGGNVCNPTTPGSTCSDTRVTPLGVVPVLTTVKNGVLNNSVVAPNDQSNPGDTIAYTITVTNSGNAAATAVTVSDPRLPGLVCVPANGSPIPAGSSMTCTGTYTLVAGDVSTGSVTNTATAAGGNVCNPTTVGSICSDSVVTPLALVPILTTTKSGVLNNSVVAPNDQSNPGDTIAYTITVANSGNGPASNVNVTDALPGITLSCTVGGPVVPLPIATLNAGATLTCTGTYTLVAGDVSTGSVTNVATTTGSNVCNPTTAGSVCGDNEVTPLAVFPLLTTTKVGVLDNTVVPPNSESNPGDTIAYTITVTNSGNAAATGVTVSDPRLPGLVCVPANGSSIPSGSSMTCTGTYALTLSDVGNGSVSNTATISGTNVCNPTTAGSVCTDTEVTPLAVAPVLTTTKTGVLNNAVVAPNDQSNVGDTIAYTITVANSGNAAATAVTVSDPRLPGLVCVPANGSPIPAGSSMSCTGTYTLVAGDVSTGSVTNTATVTGGNVCNPTTAGSTCSDGEVTPLAVVPVLTTTKTGVLNNSVVAPNDQSNVGDTIAYTITVANSGNGAATAVTVSDPRLPGLVCVPANGSSIPAGSSMVCTGTYTLVAGDVSTGSVTNTATVTGGNVCNPTTAGSTCSDGEVTPLNLLPVLTTTKTSVLNNGVVAPSNESNPGDTIAYTITVVNSGNGPANGVVVTDPRLPGAALTCAPVSGSTLAAGATMTCTGTYTLVAGDVSTGSVTNTATTTATNACNPTTAGSVCSDTEITPLGVVPVLTTTKTGVLNNAVVAPNDQSNVGDTIAYTITVTNSGNAAATAVTVSDPRLPGLVCVPANGSPIPAGSSMTCTGTYTLVAGDVSTGSVTNTATVTGGNVCNPTTAGSTCSDGEVTPLAVVPVLTTTKTGVLNNSVVAPNDQSNVGDTIAYTITVANSGNGAATAVTVSDPRLPGLVCVPANGSPIPAGSSMSCTGTYTLVAGDVSTGSVTNTATVTGGNVCNPTTSGSTCSDGEVTPLNLLPVLTTTKTSVLNNAVVMPANESNPGDTIAYTITVVNSGNGPANGVVVTDPRLPGAALTCAPVSGSTLAAGATMTCTGTYTLVAGDVSTGSVTNTATTTATNVCNPTTAGSVCSDTQVTPLGQVPALTLTKTSVLVNTVVAPNDTSNPGDRIDYTLTVVNSGTAAANGVSVNDPRIATLACTISAAPVALPTTLNAGATLICTGSYTLTNADLVTGSVSNTATVTGSGVCNPTTVGSTCTDTEVTPLQPRPDLTIVKVHSGSFVRGQTGGIYTLTVSNGGPVATSGPVLVSDVLPVGLTATAISGSGWSCVLATLTCSRADALASGASYPPITLLVNVAMDAPDNVLNTAIVEGGGDSDPDNNTDDDPVVITSLQALEPPAPIPLDARWALLLLAGLMMLVGVRATARR